MRQHRHERIRNRANDTLRHFRFAEIESRMHRSDDEIELRQNFIVEIERAVAQDVAFDSAENPNASRVSLCSFRIRACCTCSRAASSPCACIELRL